MPKLRVHNFSVSLDGYAAGPDQGPDHPVGVGGHQLHEWAFTTPTFQMMFQSGDTEPGDTYDATGSTLDEAFAAAGAVGIGATIIGRNMFGPHRGPWRDGSWQGWWGPNPPFHHPVLVLTHHPRPAIEMTGGTTFHFVTGDIESVLERAFDAAGGQDVRLGGGVRCVQQFLRVGLIDEMHLAFTPVLLGGGERLFDNLGGPVDYRCAELVSSPTAVHARFVRVPAER